MTKVLIVYDTDNLVADDDSAEEEGATTYKEAADLIADALEDTLTSEEAKSLVIVISDSVYRPNENS